jgi:hypothetical protein
LAIVRQEGEMSTGKETAKVLRDVKIDVKTKLSALWVVLMFCYT